MSFTGYWRCHNPTGSRQLELLYGIHIINQIIIMTATWFSILLRIFHIKAEHWQQVNIGVSSSTSSFLQTYKYEWRRQHTDALPPVRGWPVSGLADAGGAVAAAAGHPQAVCVVAAQVAHQSGRRSHRGRRGTVCGSKPSWNGGHNTNTIFYYLLQGVVAV